MIGCRLAEGLLKTDTDRVHYSHIYTPYDAPPYQLINTPSRRPTRRLLFGTLSTGPDVVI